MLSEISSCWVLQIARRKQVQLQHSFSVGDPVLSCQSSPSNWLTHPLSVKVVPFLHPSAVVLCTMQAGCLFLRLKTTVWNIDSWWHTTS